MRPIHIKIGHYRALRDISVALGDYTAMVGPNGVGKSTILDALDYFLSPDRVAESDDFQRGCEEPISVTLTFTDLNDAERDEYAEVLDDAGNLVVTKTCRQDEAPRYEVLGMRHLGFDQLRSIERTASKSEFNAEFRAFVAEGKYDLKAGRSASDNLAELRRWENEHPDQCEEALVPFAFMASTKEQLISTLRVVYVPAVQEASDLLGGSRSPLTQMLRAFVYPRFESNEAFVNLQRHVTQQYAALFPIEGTPELATLAKQITDALNAFCPGAAVTLGWAEYKSVLQPPAVIPQVIEDGIGTDVEHKGHGLQRALIIAMLQAEDEHRRTGNASLDAAHVILMIEEPELYQHPTQCRHFRRVLTNLAPAHSGVSVIVTTHSPDFISLDGIGAIKILRREPTDKGVPARRISTVSLDEIIERYSAVMGKSIDEPQLFRQLHVVDNIMREAFFASAVVLVEGVGDYGLLSAQCALDGLDLEGKGIVLIPCGGKSNMPLPICILDLLGIRHYAVFDSDRDQQQNRPLLRALGVPESAIPESGTPETAILETYAVLKPRIVEVVRGSIGAKAFDEEALRVAEEFGRTQEQVLKNPVTAERLLGDLRDAGLASEPLREIVLRISYL